MEFAENQRVRKLSFFTFSSNIHVDDEVIQGPPGEKIIVQNKPGTFKMRFPS